MKPHRRVPKAPLSSPRCLGVPDIPDGSEDDAPAGEGYCELAITPDDLKVAGYSVLDGNRMEEIYQAVSSELEAYDGQGHGWKYMKALSYPGRLRMEYIEGPGHRNIGSIEYTIEDLRWADEKMPARVYIVCRMDDSRIPKDCWPLLSCGVLPGASYKEVIRHYGLDELIQQAAGTGVQGRMSCDFFSQYGETTLTVTDKNAASGEDVVILEIANHVDLLEPGGFLMYMEFRHGLLAAMWFEYKTEMDPFDHFAFNSRHNVKSLS